MPIPSYWKLDTGDRQLEMPLSPPHQPLHHAEAALLLARHLRRHAAHLLEHLLHLDELLQQAVDLLARRAAAPCDAFAPAAADQLVISLLVRGHRIDDRLDP